MTGKEVPGDVAPLLRRAPDRVGSEADPIHPLDPSTRVGRLRMLAALLIYPDEVPGGQWK